MYQPWDRLVSPMEDAVLRARQDSVSTWSIWEEVRKPGHMQAQIGQRAAKHSNHRKLEAESRGTQKGVCVMFLYLLWLLFYIGVELINNLTLTSGVKQSDSVTHIPVSVLFQVLFPFRLLQNIEQSSLCYAVGPWWFSILNVAVCICKFQTLF